MYKNKCVVKQIFVVLIFALYFGFKKETFVRRTYQVYTWWIMNFLAFKT